MHTILQYAPSRSWSRAFLIGLVSSLGVSLSGCATLDHVKGGAQVSPFIGRSDSMSDGGYALPAQCRRNAPNYAAGKTCAPGDYPDVKELRLAQPMPVDLDSLIIPGLEPPYLPENDAEALNAANAAAMVAETKAKAAQEASLAATKKAANAASPQAKKAAANAATKATAAADAATKAQSDAAEKKAVLDAQRRLRARLKAFDHGAPFTAYEVASLDATSRNRLQDYLLARSDEICISHKSDIMAIASMVNTSLSSVTSIVGSIGAVVSGTAATHALSGVAGLSNGLRENFNQNVYYSNFADAIVRQVDKQRQAKWQEIAPNRAKPIDEYSVDAAIRDVNDYHFQCSFSEAVAALANDTKRPATSDELIGRLSALRSQYDANQKLIQTAQQQKDPSADVLIQTNKMLANLMQSITVQLGVSNRTALPITNGKPNGSAAAQPAAGSAPAAGTQPAAAATANH